MKRILTFGLAFFFFGNIYLIAQTCTAVPVLTLTGAPGTQVFVAFNPIKKIYYTVGGGGITNMPVTTYSISGGAPLANVTANNDFRGLWWNDNTNILESNGCSSTGIFSVTLVGGNGYASGGGSIIATNSQPDIQSCGSLNSTLNQVVYYYNGSIYKYSRATGLLTSSVVITGLPVGLGNISSFNGFYTGKPGAEYAIYDYINKRAYTIDYITGSYISTIQFPASSPAPTAFGLAYCNNLFFLSDGAGKWFGYAAGIYVSALNAPGCPGTTTTLSAISANNYTWSTGATTSSINVSPLFTTSYSVSCTATVGCPSSVTITVNVNPAPAITITGNTVICVSGTNVITANGANSYTWNTAATTASISDSPTLTTIYTVTGTSSLGCVGSTTTSIVVSANPTVSISNSVTICAGQIATLTASGANTYSWSNGALTASALLSPNVNTIYSVIGTNSLGCFDMAAQSVSVIASPTVTINGGITSICPGGMFLLLATGADTYSWNTGALTNTIVTSPSVTTTYSVIGTSTTSGCPNTAIQTVTVNPTPVISVAGAGILCEGLSATLTANGANTYTWNTGSNLTSIVDSPTVNTTYTVAGTSTAGCVGSTTVNVTITICTGISQYPILNPDSYRDQYSSYPNPTKGEFTINLSSFTENTQIEIYNSTGQLISNSKVNSNETNFNLSSYSSGIYLIKIIRDNKIIGVTKVVKE